MSTSREPIYDITGQPLSHGDHVRIKFKKLSISLSGDDLPIPPVGLTSSFHYLSHSSATAEGTDSPIIPADAGSSTHQKVVFKLEHVTEEAHATHNTIRLRVPSLNSVVSSTGISPRRLTLKSYDRPGVSAEEYIIEGGKDDDGHYGYYISDSKLRWHEEMKPFPTWSVSERNRIEFSDEYSERNNVKPMFCYFEKHNI